MILIKDKSAERVLWVCKTLVDMIDADMQDSSCSYIDAGCRWCEDIVTS